jgi:hypothetical protein
VPPCAAAASVTLYPEFQAFFRKYQPPTLIGKRFGGDTLRRVISL